MEKRRHRKHIVTGDPDDRRFMVGGKGVKMRRS